MSASYWLEILTMAGIMSIAALGLYAIKITGQLAAGHAAFLGLGGYIGGMLTATILAIFYIPFFFVLVRRGVRDGMIAIRERMRRRREARA